jgi:hypothetical protein
MQKNISSSGKFQRRYKSDYLRNNTETLHSEQLKSAPKFERIEGLFLFLGGIIETSPQTITYTIIE